MARCGRRDRKSGMFATEGDAVARVEFRGVVEFGVALAEAVGPHGRDAAGPPESRRRVCRRQTGSVGSNVNDSTAGTSRPDSRNGSGKDSADPGLCTAPGRSTGTVWDVAALGAEWTTTDNGQNRSNGCRR